MVSAVFWTVFKPSGRTSQTGLRSTKPAHVLPPDVRHMVAETAFVKFQQAMAMAVLLAAHVAEFFGLFGIIRLQAVGEIFVDAGVLLFQRNGQREDFLFGQAVECFHIKIVFLFRRAEFCDAPTNSNCGARGTRPSAVNS